MNFGSLSSIHVIGEGRRIGNGEWGQGQGIMAEKGEAGVDRYEVVIMMDD
jgi:hypothetical protein